MRQLKKTLLTLVALLAVTTGAWAQGKLIYEKDFASDTDYPFYLDNASESGASAKVTNGLLVLTNPKVQAKNWDVQPEIGKPTSAAPTTQGNTYRVVMQYKTTVAGSVTFALGASNWTNTDWSEQTITVSNDFQTCEAYFFNFPYSNTESHILLQFGSLEATITVKKVEVYELNPFPITWDTTTKTATIASMPAGNVIVIPEYYPQAALAMSTDATPVALAPTANNSARANTDDPLVEGGTVAGIVDGEALLEEGQGTLLYHFSATQLDDAALEALTATDWTDKVPTADGLAEGTVYVYYYIKGADDQPGNTPGAKFTFSDTDIQELAVTLAPEPTYNVEFAEGTNNAPNKWTATPNPAKKGQQVTVTYEGPRKVMGVKAEKKSAEKTITIGEQNYTVLNGETWKQFITRNQLSGWTVAPNPDTTWYVYNNKPSYKLRFKSDGNNWEMLVLTSEDAPIDTDKQYTLGYD